MHLYLPHPELAGIKVIKSFTQEANEVENFADINRQYIRKNMGLARVRSISGRS